MRVFLTYLWKEWRDHRTVLVGMLVVVPLLLTVMGLAAPKKELGEAERLGFATFLSVACLALFVISLATDLVPGEARRGHRWFLERLPGGLGAAFRAKLALFAVGGAIFALYGYLVAAVMCRILAGGWPPLPAPGSTTALIAIAALWTFAVSCALPRGALSLPAVAALALLLALPALGLWMLFPSRGPAAWWRWESGALWAAGAVAAAWVAFRRRGFLRAGRACLVVGAVCAMPYWADAAHDAWSWHRHSVVEIQDVFLGEGGNYAFVNRMRRGVACGFSPIAPVIVDLRTGRAREAGGKLSRFGADRIGSRLVDHAFVWLWKAGGAATIVVDGRTAVERPEITVEDKEAAWRARPVGRLPDGRSAWLRGSTVVTEAADGGFEVLFRDTSPCGLGFESWMPRGYYDLSRGRSYASRDLALRGERVWIRPGAWLARKDNQYKLFDPDTNTLSPALGFAGVGDVVAILDDGRVVAACKGETLALIAPESGAVTKIATPPGFERCFVWSDRIRMPVRTPDGRRILLLVHDDGASQMTEDRYACVFVRQDEDAFVATAPVRGLVTLLGCPTDDTVLVHDDRAIYRLRFGSDVREEIWHAR